MVSDEGDVRCVAFCLQEELYATSKESVPSLANARLSLIIRNPRTLPVAVPANARGFPNSDVSQAIIDVSTCNFGPDLTAMLPPRQQLPSQALPSHSLTHDICHACLPHLPTAVSSGSTVVYNCLRGEDPWTSGPVELTATTGPANCRGIGVGVNSIEVLEKPKVHVLAPTQVSICKDSTAESVDLIFTVAGDKPVSVPREISTLDNSLTCFAQGNINNGKYRR